MIRTIKDARKLTKLVKLGYKTIHYGFKNSDEEIDIIRDREKRRFILISESKENNQYTKSIISEKALIDYIWTNKENIDRYPCNWFS